MSAEAKAKLMERLRAGRDKTKMARAEAKEKGLPDPKPRKPRKKKNLEGTAMPAGSTVDPKEAIANPSSAPAANEKLPPIDGAPRNAVNAVSAKPVDPTASKSTPIDVPNLPGDGKKVASKQDIVKDAEAPPKPKAEKGLSTTGMPERYNDNVMIRSEETGNQAIEAQYPGQKESIKKLLKANKKDDPLAPKPVAEPPSKTVKSVKEHIPNMEMVEAKKPFSYSTIRRLLYQ